MKSILYKVETYIVPEADLSVIKNLNSFNIADIFNIKSDNIPKNDTQHKEDTLRTLHNKCQDFTNISIKNNENLIETKNVKNEIETKIETVFDECYDNDIIKYYENSCYSKERLPVQKQEFQTSIGPQESLYPAKQFSKINNLTSIDEKSENSMDNTKINDFCHHGYKNGCTATIPPPEEVSEEIFKENWLQKIEALKNRETILQEKETNLQKRERELFRKEKELRIAERTLNEKIKQLEQQLRHQQDMLVGKTLEEAARILSRNIERSDTPSEEKKDGPKNIKKSDTSSEEKKHVPRKDISKKDFSEKGEQDKEEVSKKVEIPKVADISKTIDVLAKTETSNDPQYITNPTEWKKECNKRTIPLTHSNLSSKTSFRRTRSYAGLRSKEKTKRNYDELNSTLSAESVNSPHIRTSQWFNPTLYKKPQAFTRTASERWTRYKDTEKLQKITEEKFKENKIFQKVSDNICALQEKETKFQNYGLVDCIPVNSNKEEYHSNSEEKLSSLIHLGTEVIEKNSHRNIAKSSVMKDRPISWPNKMNERLQQKHQVHNSEIKATENKNATCNTRRVAKTIVKPNLKRFFLFR